MVALFRRQQSFKDSDISLRHCFSFESELLIGQRHGVSSSIHLSTNSPRMRAIKGEGGGGGGLNHES